MFCSAINRITPVHGYPQAQRHFNSLRKPRTNRWGEDERPLYKTSTHHYRLVQGPLLEDGMAAYYDCVLYNTPIIRYFPHDSNTLTHTIWLRSYGTSATHKFMHRVSGYYGGRTMRTVDADDVRVPLNCVVGDTFTADNGVTIPQGWSAVLVLDRNNRIFTSLSAHRPVYRKVTSDSRSEDRAAFAAFIQPFVDMLLLSLPAIHAEAQVSYRKGRPFSGRKDLPYDYMRLISEFPTAEADVQEGHFIALRMLLANVYETALNKWLYNYDQNKETVRVPQEVVTQAMSGWKSQPVPDEVPVLPAEKVRRPFMDALMDMRGFRRGDEYEALPQFPEQLPKTYYYR